MSRCFSATLYTNIPFTPDRLLYPARYRWGKRIVDVIPGGTEFELRLRWGVEQVAHTRNNPHVKCTGVYCA